MRSFSFQRISILILLTAAFYLLGNNLISLTDPDEVFYSLTAREMVSHHEWATPLIFGQPQFEKPILTYWLLAGAFKTWGESPFTARLFPALFALLGVVLIYILGVLSFKEERKAFLSALILATSGFYVAMAKTVFTDMIFTVFILGAFTMFMVGFTMPKYKAFGWIAFFIFAGLATLTKTPLGLIISLLGVILFLLYQRQIYFLKTLWVPIGFCFYLAIAVPWYLHAYQHYGQTFIHEFFYNDHWRRFLEAEHRSNDHWFFYPLTMLLGLFPWTLFLAAASIDLFKRLKTSVSLVDYLALSWIFIVLFVFQTAHSKLASYILPLFPALALMTGNFIGNALKQIQEQKKIQGLLIGSFSVLIVFGIAVMAGQKAYKHYISSMLPVYFLSSALIAIGGIGIALTLRERFYGALYLLALTLCPIFCTAFMIRFDIEGLVSSKEASAYIPPRSSGILTVLTSKANARGVRYYTGQEVAVVDYSAKPFFSPHPIPILDTTAKVFKVCDAQRVTFGIIRKSAYKDIVKNCPKNYHLTLLRNIGYDYIIRLEAVKH